MTDGFLLTCRYNVCHRLGKSVLDDTGEFRKQFRFIAHILRSQANLPRHLLRKVQQRKETLIRAVNIAVRRHEVAVVLNQSTECRLVEVAPVECMRKNMRLGGRLRQILEEESRDNAEVAAPTSEMTPDEILLVSVIGITTDRDRLGATFFRDVDHFDGMQIVNC